MTSRPAPGASLPPNASLLIVRLSALGDVLFTLPAVAALQRARPDLAIDWVVEERAASLLDLAPGLRQTIVWRRGELSRQLRNPLRWPAALVATLRHLGALRKRRYDAVADFQGNLKSGVHTLLARGRRKFGFAKGTAREGNWLLHGERVAPPDGALHRVDQSQALARALDAGVDPQPAAPPLVIPEASRRFADAALDETQIGSAPYAILHPGTSAFGEFKRWAPDRFALVGDRLAERGGLRVLVTWGPGEEGLAQQVVAGMRSGAGRLSPRTRSLADLAALEQRARLVIASDTAALHLAAFLGTPIVALYGPKDPRKYGPRFAPLRVVHTHLPCSPCSRRSCPDVLCMDEIGVGQVLDAARELLPDFLAAATVR